MSTQKTTPGIQVSGLVKSFGRETVLRDVDLTVEPGEFCILIGPSGSGKSSVLKSIAGLIEPDAGQVLIDGEDVADTPVAERDLGFVFQEFEETLFPHMTVAENVAFGLEESDDDYSSGEIDERVDEMLDLLAISETREDRPEALSGGQQQRVELARQLVRDCEVMLLDDPLADLDYKLQKRMELELRRLHAETGGTYLYVTHNQEQALTLADKLVVINDGRIEQVGTPTAVYENPANAYVGRFVGDSNLFEARVTDVGDAGIDTETSIGDVAARPGHDGLAAEDDGVVLVRPENVALGDDATDLANHVVGRPEDRIYTGERTEFIVSVDADGGERTVQSIYPGNVTFEDLQAGDTVDLGWRRADAAAFTRLSTSGEVTVDQLRRL